MAGKSSIPIEKWIAIETDYIQGKGTVDELAVRHGMVISTVRNRCFGHRWHSKRKEFIERSRQNAISTQPGLVPPMNPADNHAARLQVELNPAFFLEENTNYFKKSLELLARMEDVVRKKLAKLSGQVDPDFEELASVSKVLDTILERRRIVLGIPLVAPIKRVEKNTKRGGDIVPIEAYENPIPEVSLPDGGPSMDSSPGLEVAEVQEVPAKPAKPPLAVPEAEVDENWA
jgi:hypothetical protein